VHVYLDDKDNIKDIIYENVPVYNKSKCNIKPNQTVTVPVTINLPKDSEHHNLNLMLFESIPNKSEQPKLEPMNGIIDQNSKEHYIMITSSNTNNEQNIPKNGIIGRVSTIITMPEEEEPLENSWTLIKLKNEIKLEDNLTDNEKDKVYDMILRQKEALSTGDADIGMAKVTPHHIELTDYTPIWQKPRSFAEPVNQEIENQCKELLAEDIIEYSNSNWSSPVVPVRKTDGTMRLCVDYRKINAVTKTESFPMPNINQCIYKARNIKYFTKLDLVRGYYQVPIDNNSKQYTAFSTTKNHFQFKRLSFGLKNSGIAFQKVMQQILSPHLNSNIIIYIDDILILSENFTEHLDSVSKILTTLKKNGIKIKVKKCDFF
jgi:hypothetical protein